jgi:hypothetical protein
VGGVRKREIVSAAFFPSEHAGYRFGVRGRVVRVVAIICLRVIGADSWRS